MSLEQDPQPEPVAAPEELAWEAYKLTAEFQEALRWSVRAGWTENGVHAAFIAGFNSH